MKAKMIKFLSVLSIAFVLGAALAPVIYDETHEDSSDSDAILAFLTVYGAWSLVDDLLGLFNSGDSGGSGNIDPGSEYQEQIKDFETYIGSHMADISGGLSIDAQTLSYTQLYWSRSAEIAVSGLWTAASDPSDHVTEILRASNMIPFMSTHYRSWESLIDTPLVSFANIPAENDAAGYGEIEWGLYADGRSFAADSKIQLDAGTIASGNGGRFYLTKEGIENSGATTLMTTLYCLTPGTIVCDDGARYSIQPGRYTLTDFHEGFYTISSGTYIGPFLPAGPGSADLRGAMAVNIDGTSGYIAPSDSSGYDVVVGSESVHCTDVGVYGAYPDGGETVRSTRSVAPTIASWNSLISMYSSIVTGLQQAAAAMWKLCDETGEVNPQASLVAYMPDLANLTLSAEQIYAAGVLSLIQNSEWYASHQSQIDSSEIRISAESLSLYVTGSIYDERGRVLAENVVYTPYTYLRNQHVSTKNDVRWDQSGFAIVWTDDTSGTNVTADIASMRLIPIQPGYTLHADRIVYDGDEVPSMYLEVKSMELVLSSWQESIDPEDMPKIHDYSVLVTVIFSLVAILIGYLGLRSGNVIALVIAAAILAVGILWPEIVLKLIYGDIRFLPRWIRWL